MAFCATAADYELAGQIVPETKASVSLHGAMSPFESATLSDAHGRFRFRRLAPGAYTLSVFELERGEMRQTVEVGPGVADSKGRVTVTLRLDRATFESEETRRRRAMPTCSPMPKRHARRTITKPTSATSRCTFAIDRS